MEIIYTLELENGKYYVGVSNNPERRIERHMNANGSEWTKLYKPVRIIDTHEKQSQFDEDNTTKQMMLEYGIENVRGGSYCKIELEEWQIKSLESEFRGITNKCYKCGKTGHYAADCCKQVNKYEGWTEEQLEERKNKLTACLDCINNKQIVEYKINFLDNYKHYSRYNPIINKYVDNKFSNDINITPNYKDIIRSHVNRHFRLPENNKLSQWEIQEIKNAFKRAEDQYIYIIEGNLVEKINNINKSNNVTRENLSIVLRQLILNDKRQTKLLNELLTHNDKQYNSYKELRPIIIKEIEEILDALIEMA